MPICKDLVSKLLKYIPVHKRAQILEYQCPICKNYINLVSLDKDIEIEKNCTNVISINIISDQAQKIHVIGNHWPLINALKHRQFKFMTYKYTTYANPFATYANPYAKSYVNSYVKRSKNLCITDIDIFEHLMNEKSSKDFYQDKFVITQQSSASDLYTKLDFDYLIIEKKYIKEVPEYKPDFDIPDKGFLIVDFKNNFKKYYNLDKEERCIR